MFREILDKLLLTNIEWKEKYCKTLNEYVSGTTEQRKQLFLKMMEGAEERFNEGVKMEVCGIIEI